MSRTTVHRLREQGDLVAVGRGLVQFHDAGMGALSDLAVVSARAPGGTICLSSALAYWDLTDEVPIKVHLAVRRGAHRPVIDIPRVRVHVFAADSFGLERRQALTDVDEPFWIYSAERTIVDAIRMARWVGRDVGLHALRRYTTTPGAEPAKVSGLARQLGGERSVMAALEALLS